jgi:hypothetical protein
MITLGKSSIQMELSCSASTSGRPRASLIDDPDHGTPGNGLLLFFRVDDFAVALQRARSLLTRLEEEPHLSPNTQTKEFSLRDPDGYYVTISASLQPDKALQLPSAGPGFMGQRGPNSLPSQGGSCRLIAYPIGNVSRSFDYSDRVTGKPEVVPPGLVPRNVLSWAVGSPNGFTPPDAYPVEVAFCSSSLTCTGCIRDQNHLANVIVRLRKATWPTSLPCR